MPHPLALFTYITLIVVALSAIASFLGFSAISPSTGKLIEEELNKCKRFNTIYARIC